MAEEPAPATQEATNGGPGQPAGAKGNFRGSGADGSRGGGRRGRGRGRGRAGGERSGGDRRPGGRGRAGNLGGQSSTAPMAPGTQNRLDQAAAQATAATGEAAEDEIDDSVCFICANPVTYYSIGPCGHSTCHICSLRMRALYNTKACAHCRTEAEYVIFAADEEKKYDQYSDADFVQTDVNLGIKYTTEAINQDTLLLLRYNCPEPTCDVQCHGWKALHAHVRAAHNQYLCRLCTHFKKVFTHEHALFSIQELRKHERDGDDLPGSTEQSGFKGHPECGFCKERFYSSDELYQHCRHSHETCVICDRRSFSRSQQYYLDADALALHYQKEHYSCTERECVEKKVVVFESQEELNAHMLEVHPNALSKSAKRDARKINIVPYDSFPQGHGHGRGRGRDPNANIPPQRSEQPLRRDELAYQRTLAVQSSQSTTTRNFGGQLTAQLVPPPVPRAAAQPQRPAAGPKPGTSQPAQAQRSGPSVQPIPPPAPRTPPIIRAQPSVAPSPSHFPPLSASSQFPPLSGTQTRLDPQPPQRSPPVPQQSAEEKKKARHTAVVERAATLLKGDARKLDTFRQYVSDYRSGAKTARETCDAFWSLFDAPANELGIVIRNLAELYESEKKRSDLLAAWNSWRAVNEDFPQIAGARVLKIKSSTTPSARSARQGAWGTAAAAPSAFNASSSSRQTTSAPKPMMWISPASSSSAAPRAIVTTTADRIAPNNKTRAPGNAEFPSLPPKTPMHTFGPVIRNGASGGRGSGAVANAWTTAGQNGNSVARSEEYSKSDEEPSGRKKKGKQKQTLFHFG